MQFITLNKKNKVTIAQTLSVEYQLPMNPFLREDFTSLPSDYLNT